MREGREGGRESGREVERGKGEGVWESPFRVLSVTKKL